MALTLHIPKALAHWVIARPWLHVRYASRARLDGEQWEVPIEIHRVGPFPDTELLVERLRADVESGATSVPLVASSFIARDLREALEAAGAGYLDGAGRLHLRWRQGLIHLAPEKKAVRQRRTTTRTLGVHGVRAVQAILDHPGDFKVTALASRVGLSASRVHTIFTILEEEGLLRTRGSGPATIREVVDRTRLLEWLAAQPAARRRERHVDATLYGRTPADAWRRAAIALDEAGIRHALTGSAAASVLGAGPTNVPLATLRIDPECSLEEAVAAMRAKTTDRGANLRLLCDTGMVGSFDIVERDRLRLAPPARVYLDVMSERRGEDVAELFREAVLGY